MELRGQRSVFREANLARTGKAAHLERGGGAKVP